MSGMNTKPDTDLYEFCANGDGTYNGVKMVQFLMEALTKKPFSEEQAILLAEEAKARAEAKRKARKCAE